jgi:hypothetical protein
MRAAKKNTLSFVKIRPGRRWPRRRVSVFDDRLLGAQWAWEHDEDHAEEAPTSLLSVPADLYLA